MTDTVELQMPPAEAFAAHRDLLDQIARRFCRRYGTRFDETQAEAYFRFLQAHADHDPVRSRLEQRIQFVVWRGLLDWLGEIIRTGKPERPIAGHLEARTTPEPFDVRELTSRLGDDAAFVVSILLEPNADLEEMRAAAPTRKNSTTFVIKRNLRNYLSRRFHMPYKDINAAFAEIGAAL